VLACLLLIGVASGVDADAVDRQRGHATPTQSPSPTQALARHSVNRSIDPRSQPTTPVESDRDTAPFRKADLTLNQPRVRVEPVATPTAPVAPAAAPATPLPTAATTVAPTVAPTTQVPSQPELPYQPVALTPLTVDVLNADERYFAISGGAPNLLIASAKANIPADPSGADRHSMAYAGPTVWDHQPSYVIDPEAGTCTMTGVASTTRYQATLPQWTSPSSVPPQLLAWWRVVLEHIRQHEEHHIRIFAEFVNNLPARVTGQPCDSWDAIVSAWTADVVSAQAAFDAVEAGWVLPVYTGPLDS